jgi:hypothetical protein
MIVHLHLLSSTFSKYCRLREVICSDSQSMSGDTTVGTAENCSARLAPDTRYGTANSSGGYSYSVTKLRN